MVRVEIAVLTREQGIDEVLRHLVDRDRLPVLLPEELRDLPVVDVQDFRGKRHVLLAELLLRRNVPRGGKTDPEGDAEDDRYGKGDDEKNFERGLFSGKRTH